MKKLFFLTIIFSLVFLSCKKNETEPAPAQKTVLTIFKKSDNPYQIWSNGKQIATIYNDVTDIQINATYHELRAIQVSGYIISPTEHFKTLNAKPGQTYYWNF